MEKKDLKPANVFGYFEDICQVPRPSKHEEKITKFLKEFGEKHNLETKVDKVGNVLIKKPATPGYENRKTIVLQSHIDMVCEKNNDVEHDFFNDPIQTYIDGEWLRAKGTTLGADNGIGVATEMAVLTDSSLEHGPIECLFTIDEETGLTGAFALEEGFMNGDILLNLDSEDEGELFIGCAGGVDSMATFTYSEEEIPQGFSSMKIVVKGLNGGHSGDDINKGLGNANKILTRLLHHTAKHFDMFLSMIDGGNLRNAIAREAQAVISIPAEKKEEWLKDMDRLSKEIIEENATNEKSLKIIFDVADNQLKAIDRNTTKNLINTLYALPHGVFAMSQDIPGLVETSTNLASVKMKPENKILIATSQRSSTNSSKEDIANMVRTVMEMGGAEVSFGDGYPGWKPNPNSEILEVAVDSYKKLFGKEPKVKSIHAGLECGLFLDKYPHLDMISFGPTLRGVHSPDEKMLIPTVQKFWDHLVDVLKNTPNK